jgi:hypothetical protein
MSLGGHMVFCKENPLRETTLKKVSQKALGRPLSNEHKRNVSLTVSRKVEQGTWHNSFSKCRKKLYAGQSFDGSWEVELARWFDSEKIEWIRNQESFPYFFEKDRKYIPDFYLPQIDCYVEVKGWKTAKDDAKWSHFPKRLIVLSGTDLQNLGIPIHVRKDWK